jgi:hypothetical protein
MRLARVSQSGDTSTSVLADARNCWAFARTRRSTAALPARPPLTAADRRKPPQKRDAWTRAADNQSLPPREGTSGEWIDRLITGRCLLGRFLQAEARDGKATLCGRAKRELFCPLRGTLWGQKRAPNDQPGLTDAVLRRLHGVWGHAKSACSSRERVPKASGGGKKGVCARARGDGREVGVWLAGSSNQLLRQAKSLACAGAGEAWGLTGFDLGRGRGVSAVNSGAWRGLLSGIDHRAQFAWSATGRTCNAAPSVPRDSMRQG